ncbi:MAG: type I DNA topoisomerase [Gemmatimonadetes bacterium]|nr:type I DNA topoisomerase [Gemmatimonadota bacterium]
MKLVIVESPAKAKTIGRFLGPDYRVEASYGHIRDLPRSARETPSAIREKPWGRLGVDTQNGFRPVYVVPDESKKHVRELTKLLRQADEILLATDEDREGESISWHLLEVLKPSVPVRRIAFHEITKPAIREALANPREVNRRLVQAQEARRVLDRLYGYELSPVLWKKVRTKLSAGRVQSVALRLVVDREEERRRFVISEYWRAKAVLASGGNEFTALLVTVGGKRVAVGRDFDSATGKLLESSRALHLDRDAAGGIAAAALDAAPWRVGRVDRKSTRQRPAPPFTTSTLQQAASSRLRLSPRQTMRSAQRLYEGIDLGGGDREGLITYMRTDSVTLSNKALGDAGRYIRRVFGDEYHVGPRRYRTKSKIAQEAHEGIRPTEIGRTPDELARFLGRDELALYRLIWGRTVASQMADARVDRTNVDLIAPIGGVDHAFRATGSVLRFPGYLKVYGDNRKDQLLPALDEGDLLHAEGRLAPGDALAREEVDPDRPPTVIRSVEPDRRETSPPSRYSEASLVKKLEDEGIGRPSTYTPTISTIQDRDYVRKRGGALVPTYIGMAVIQLLRQHFGRYIDLGFTARMEDSLDDIAAGEADSRRFLESFYNGEGDRPGLVRQIEDALPGIDFPKVPVGTDPETGKPIRVRIGKTSVFAERGEGDRADRATIPTDLLIDELTVERAGELLKIGSGGGEHLGDDPETGLPVFVRVGPFGPYVQLGQARKGGEKPRWVGLPKGMQVPDVTLDQALRLLSLPRTVGKDPESGEEVRAGLGKYGPYVVRAREYRSLQTADQIFSVTLDEALRLLAQPKRRRGRKVLRVVGIHPETGAEIQLLEGRYGPYVTDGNANASVPKDRDPAATTVEEAVELLTRAARRKKGRAPRGRRRASARTPGRR